MDPQIIRSDGSSFSALSLKAMLNLLRKESEAGNNRAVDIFANKLDPLDLGEIERTLSISTKYASCLLVKRMFKGCDENNEKIKEISRKLTEGYTHHSYLIEFNEATLMGLKVSRPSKEKDIEKKVNNLFELQMRISELREIDAKLYEYDYNTKRR